MTAGNVHESWGASEGAPRFSPIEDDILSYRLIQFENLADSTTELELFSRKWFDYRQLTPLQATRLYVGAYCEAYRRHYRTNFDRSTAKFIKPVSFDNEEIDGLEALLRPAIDLTGAVLKLHEKKVRKSRTQFTGCWRGRRIADHIGIPYDVYIDLAFEFRLNYWNQGSMPRPTHLYSEMVVTKIVDRWEELQASRLFLSHDPAYLVQNYADIGHQNDYHEWLIKQAELRANPPVFLARFVNDDMLPLEKIEHRFDAETVERVSRHLIQ